jgi:hypothetical protein
LVFGGLRKDAQFAIDDQESLLLDEAKRKLQNKATSSGSW